LGSEPVLKLELEPIPESTWGRSLAQLLPKEVWDDLRREVYAAYNYTCAICGAKDKQLHCHERWEFDDKKHIQYLAGLVCLCRDCHEVKHWGRTVAEAHKNGDSGKIVRLTKHFCDVNNCSEKAFNLHKIEKGAINQERSRHKYTVNFGKFRPDLVEKIWKEQRSR
jgi:hypothetical protein